MPLTLQQQRLLEWSLTPKRLRNPATKKALSEEIGVKEDTLRAWAKKTDFLTEFDKGVYSEGLSGEKAQLMLTRLYADAEQSNSPREMIKWLELRDKYFPVDLKDSSRDTLADLSDENLLQVIIDAAHLKNWTVTVLNEESDPITLTDHENVE